MECLTDCHGTKLTLSGRSSGWLGMGTSMSPGRSISVRSGTWWLRISSVMGLLLNPWLPARKRWAGSKGEKCVTKELGKENSTEGRHYQCFPYTYSSWKCANLRDLRPPGVGLALKYRANAGQHQVQVKVPCGRGPWAILFAWANYEASHCISSTLKN